MRAVSFVTVLSISLVLIASSAFALETLDKPQKPYALIFSADGVDAERTLYLATDSDVKKNIDAKAVDPMHIQIAKYDLNEDGTDEIFIYIDDAFYCGTLGCSFHIFEQKNGTLKAISPDLVTYKKWSVSGTKTNGYTDLVYDMGNGASKSWVFEDKGHIYAAKNTDTSDIDPKLQSNSGHTTSNDNTKF